MKKRNVYEKVEAAKFTEKEVLAPGGYICKILGVELNDTQWGEKLILHFDIAEGDSAGYYKRRYENKFSEDEKWKGNYRVSVPSDDGSEDDNKIASRFKRFMQDVEDSNPGFHWDWDEAKLKGKSIGILFGDKEWEHNGKTGFFANPKYTAPVSDIKEGKFKVPETQYLDKKSSTPFNTPAPQGSADFMSIPDGAEEAGFPFN